MTCPPGSMPYRVADLSLSGRLEMAPPLELMVAEGNFCVNTRKYPIKDSASL